MSALCGYLDGLKKSDLARLEKLTRRKAPAGALFSYDLAEALCEIALAIRREITLLLDAKGRVAMVVVGDTDEFDQWAPIAVPDAAAGVSGYSCFHARSGWKPPTVGDRVTLLQYHFPVFGLCVAGVGEGFSRSRGESPSFCDGVVLLRPQHTGEPESPLGCYEEPPVLARKLEQERLETYTVWADEVYSGLNVEGQTEGDRLAERAVLLAVQQGNEADVEDSLNELAQLAKTAGVQVVDRLIQPRRSVDAKTYIGSGKAQELALVLQQRRANLVIADDELTPVQQRNLERVLRVKVVDRTEVILDIFARRAQSREGIIQVELAQLKYLMPRLMGRGKMFSQQTAVGAKGGVATRGPGETKLETDRRVLSKRVTLLEQEARAVVAHRELQRKRREKQNMPVVALVGYTNAGKSTLMRQLTEADVLVADKLFATLDPTTRKLRLPGGREVLLSDTVGFIRKLPTFLVKAFQATLEEAASADILLHVWDISHPQRMSHWHSVQETLEAIEVRAKSIITVCNKVDCIEEPEEVLAQLGDLLEEAVFISAKTGEGIDTLLETVEAHLPDGYLGQLAVSAGEESDF